MVGMTRWVALVLGVIVCAGAYAAGGSSLRAEQRRWIEQGSAVADRWFHVTTTDDMPTFVDLDSVVEAGSGIYLVHVRTVPFVPNVGPRAVVLRSRINCRAGTVAFEKTRSPLEELRNPQPEPPILKAEWYPGEAPPRDKAGWPLWQFVCR